MTITVKIEKWDDWEKLYVDGELVTQGHSIIYEALEIVCENLGADFELETHEGYDE